MRAIVQRVTRGSVTISESGEVRAITHGFVIFVGITQTDTASDVSLLGSKIRSIRVFRDDAGKMNLSLYDILSPQVLIVSQFTLHADVRKGRRPSFTASASPVIAIPLYNLFVQNFIDSGIPTVTGDFGADMQVEITNDGPITLFLDTENLRK